MRLLNYDPVTRTRETFHHLGDGQYVVERVQDVEDIVELNKAAKNAISNKSLQKFKGDGQHKIGAIPMSVLAEHPEFYHDDMALMKWLDAHPEWKYMPVSLSK